MFYLALRIRQKASIRDHLNVILVTFFSKTCCCLQHIKKGLNVLNINVSAPLKAHFHPACFPIFSFWKIKLHPYLTQPRTQCSLMALVTCNLYIWLRFCVKSENAPRCARHDEWIWGGQDHVSRSTAPKITYGWKQLSTLVHYSYSIPLKPFRNSDECTISGGQRWHRSKEVWEDVFPW